MCDSNKYLYWFTAAVHQHAPPHQRVPAPPGAGNTQGHAGCAAQGAH